MVSSGKSSRRQTQSTAYREVGAALFIQRQNQEVFAMIEKNSLDIKKAKRLPKGQRTHIRRMKQAAHQDPPVVIKRNN
jgi:hypothetical protein